MCLSWFTVSSLADKKEIQYLESLTKIKNQQVEIEDRDKTIDQFREKVNSLQHHVKQYEEKEEDLASEARQLSTKSQALLDQNIQLKVPPPTPVLLVVRVLLLTRYPIHR